MSLFNTLYTVLQYISLIIILIQLAAFTYVGTKIYKSPEKNLVRLWILFTAFNVCLLAYNIVTFTDASEILKVTINTCSNVLYSICHWRLSWQYLSSAY